MACSVCKEKGHDKRQCPETKRKKEEATRIFNERLNTFAPVVLASPYVAGFLWYQLSKDSLELSRLNYFILAGDLVGLNVPEGATLGALIQKSTGVIDNLPTSKRDIAEAVADVTMQRELQSLGWRAGVLFSSVVNEIKLILSEEYKEEGTAQTSATASGYGTN